MDEKRQNGKKLGAKAIAAITGGAVVLVAIVLLCVFRDKEEAYRNIRVSEVTGTVLVNREGMEDLKAYVNMNLLSGDEIVTEAGARLALRLDDDKYVILDEQSKLILHATGTEEDSKTTLNLEYGAVFSDIKNKLSESSGYEVVTPASTMSVRGTQFEVVCREGQVKVLTYEGAVYVAPEGAEEGRIVSAGQWDVVIEAPDGTCKFEGETKNITPEDVGEFVNSYFEEAGLEIEDIVKPTEKPEPTPTANPTLSPTAIPEPTATPEPMPTATPVPTPPTPTAKPTPKPTAIPKPTPPTPPTPPAPPTPVPKPTATPSPSPSPTPSPSPAPSPEEGESVIRYYIPNPPKNLLPTQIAYNTYTITYVDDMLVLSDGTDADSYASDAAPYATHACTLEENVAPLIMEASNNYLAAALKERLEEYHLETTVECFFWCDATKMQWFDWEKKLSSATLVDGGLNLYPAYTINIPEYDNAQGWCEISCVPLLVTVEETGELFCLNLPAGATLNCESSDGATIQWVVNGTKTDTASVGHGTLTNLTLSVTK